VACVERGRAMTYAWNCSVGVAEAALLELTTQNRQLLNINSQLAQEQQEMAKEMKGTDFLRSVIGVIAQFSKSHMLLCCNNPIAGIGKLQHNLMPFAMPVVRSMVCACNQAHL